MTNRPPADDYEVKFYIEALFSTCLFILVWFVDMDDEVAGIMDIVLAVMMFHTMYVWIKWDTQLDAEGRIR